MRLSDSIIVSVPQHLTVDFGYAVWRGKQRRLQKLKRWEQKYLKTLVATATAVSDADAGTADSSTRKVQVSSTALTVKAGNSKSKDDNKTSTIAVKKGSSKKDKDDDSFINEDEEGADEDVDMDDPLSKKSSNNLQRNQFGGIVDYLEAKYVRGVMLDDVSPEEKLRQKRARAKHRKLKQLKASMPADKNEEGDEGKDTKEGENATAAEEAKLDDDDVQNDELSLSEDDARSTYSADSFLDDSQLVQEVADQVQASSHYGGMTKLEAAARIKKQKQQQGQQQQSGGDGEAALEDAYGKDGAAPSNNGLLLDYGDDAAFFVNVGDLEMEDGYHGDQADADGDDEDETLSDWAKPKGAKKKKKNKKADDDKGVKSKSNKDKDKEGTTKVKKKRKLKSLDGTDAGSVKSSKSTKSSKDDNTSTKSTKKKKAAVSSMPPTPPKKGSSSVSGSVTGSGAGASGGKSGPTKGQKKPRLSEEGKKELQRFRSRAKKLSNEKNKLYKKCVAEIKNMLEDPDDSYLPRKSGGGKSMETIKVTLSVPEGKKSGDPLMFSNPRDPSQMLRVTIPANAKPGGTFMVSLPVPKVQVSDLGDENNFSKLMKETLHDYATKYDEWMDVDFQIKEITGNLPSITIHKAKMNKFDELITEFPADLEIAIDISFLRKVVRRMTQNKKKRKESAERSTHLLLPPSKKVKKEKASTPEKKKSEPKVEESHSDVEDTNGNSKLLALKAPSRSITFEDKEFDSNDFGRFSK